MVNQAQEVKTVEIIAINPAQVAVSNAESGDRARAAGAILGAIAGAAIGNHNNHSTSSRVLGGLAGGAIGGSNAESGDRARAAGAILGAIAGAAIGNHNNHSTSSRVLGGLAGGAIGGMVGDAATGATGTAYVDGVQLVYRAPNGKIYQSAQVGRLCEFKTGPAVMVSPRANETRIQPNNPYGCARQ